MSEALTEVRIMGLIPSNNGVAVFLGNEEKTFSIHVDHGVGTNIALLLKGEKRQRPLTHDLINLIFQAFTISVVKIVINDLKDDTYFARLVLRAENEVHRKLAEIDARPSDCLAIALETKTPIYVAAKVWDQVVDISDVFDEMKKKFNDMGSDEEVGEDQDEDEDEEEEENRD
jgi:uncharacterized protein